MKTNYHIKRFYHLEERKKSIQAHVKKWVKLCGNDFDVVRYFAGTIQKIKEEQIECVKHISGIVGKDVDRPLTAEIIYLKDYR